MTSWGEMVSKFGWVVPDNAEFDDLKEEIQRAMDKHGWEQTPLNPGMFPSQKLIILVEEVGEVARAMTYDEGDTEGLADELLQVAAMSYAWYLSMVEA